MVNIEYNYVHDFGSGINSDFGGIKTGSVSNCDGESETDDEAMHKNPEHWSIP